MELTSRASVQSSSLAAAVVVVFLLLGHACLSSSEVAEQDYSHDAGPRDLCGKRFRDAAALALEASQTLPDCATHRLLVLQAPGDTFEGMGSIMIGVAEALAEAHYSGRALVIGPREAQAHVIRDAECPELNAEGPRAQRGGRLIRGFECLFRLPGACSWDSHVHREEAMLLGGGNWSPYLRVLESHPRRGGVALYAVPPELSDLLPPGLGPADAAECWAGAVVARAMRPQDPVMEQLEKAVAHHLGFEGPYAAVHLRIGDNALTDVNYKDQDPTGKSRAYSNKPLPTAKGMGKLLKNHLLKQGMAADSVFLATDHVRPNEAKAELAAALGLPPSKVKVLERYRTKHGSHTTAFAKTVMEESMKLLVPYAEVGAYLKKTKEQQVNDQSAVRREALEDIWILSNGAALAGTASSHFSVVARLWAVGRGSPSVTPLWLDGRDVAAGLLSNGHYHGQVNTTNKLYHPEARMQKYLQRFLEWPSTGKELAFTAEPERAIPIIQRSVFTQVAELWRSDNAEAFCTSCSLPDGCDTLTLVDSGATFEGSMRKQLAEACWRRALMAPGVLPARARGGGVDPEAVGEIARSNLAIVMQEMHDKGAQFLHQAVDGAPVRGEGRQMNSSSSSRSSSSTSTVRVHIEGSRSSPHSPVASAGVALANALSARPGVELSWSDASGVPDRAEASLGTGVAVVPFGGALPPGTVLLRFSPPPFNLTLSSAASRTVVFAETGNLIAPREWSADGTPWAALQATVAAPSRWAIEGLVRSGAPRSRLSLLPLPVDLELLQVAATPAAKAKARSAAGLGTKLGKRLAFLHVGALDWSRGGSETGTLLTAFLALLTRWKTTAWGPEPALVLADLSGGPGGRERFEAEVPGSLRGSHSIVYVGQPFTRAQLKDLYRSCDVFVAAGSGEPSGARLLEAAASGLAVVVPAGGAAEELLPSTFTRFVRSSLVPIQGVPPYDAGLEGGRAIVVDPDALSRAMEECATSEDRRRQAKEKGRMFVALRHSTEMVADVLLGILQDHRWATPRA